MSHYSANARLLDRAEDDANVWATVLDPADVRHDIHSHLLGAAMALIDPATFAKMVADAERFAGKPVAY